MRARLTGIPAVVFQHELDHVDGIVMTQRGETQSQQALAAVWNSADASSAWHAAAVRWQAGMMQAYNSLT